MVFEGLRQVLHRFNEWLEMRVVLDTNVAFYVLDRTFFKPQEN